MPLEIVRNDIVNMQVDVIVNTANPKAIIGSGVDSAIHKKAGPKLIEERKQIGDIKVGKAIITSAYNLEAKYIVHVVSPIWIDGNHNEELLLRNCYKEALNLAKKYNCESIAFPLLATGNNEFPKSLALQIAINEISSFLMENDMQVYLVVYNKEAFVLSEKLFSSIKSYIDENYIEERSYEEKNYSRLPNISSVIDRGLRKNKQFILSETSGLVKWDFKLENILENLDAGFSETLLKLIDETGKKDSEVYKKANIDRRLFSKIKNNIDYRPSKTTAIAFALALELDLNETKDFIARAGYALSNSSKFDVIIEYFIKHKNYNVFEINEALFEFDQPLIGS
jgi:O-acetyl-ADP-ribose deacetylase (regulator of RNase III)